MHDELTTLERVDVPYPKVDQLQRGQLQYEVGKTRRRELPTVTVEILFRRVFELVQIEAPEPLFRAQESQIARRRLAPRDDVVVGTRVCEVVEQGLRAMTGSRREMRRQDVADGTGRSEVIEAVALVGHRHRYGAAVLEDLRHQPEKADLIGDMLDDVACVTDIERAVERRRDAFVKGTPDPHEIDFFDHGGTKANISKAMPSFGCGVLA
jgi:hypothetical protein